MRLRLRSSNLTPRSPRALAVAKWFIRGWGARAVAFGIGFAVFGALEWDRASASVGWPTAEGTVVESRVHHTTRTNRGRTSNSYAPHVTYRYSVDGRELESRRIAFRVSGSSQSEAKAVVDRYPAGSAVTVHHSPDDPSLACLEPGADDWQWVPLAVGAVAVLVGMCIAWILPGKIEALMLERAAATSPEG